MNWVAPFLTVVWLLFWVYWMLSARGVTAGSPRRGRGRVPRIGIVVAALLILRGLRVNAATIHDPAVQAVGVALVLAGLGFAVWARIHLGRNWGMPMTEKDKPELVTTGPYRFVRHPIYSGLLLALAGTALAINLLWLVAAGLSAAYFIYSARVEEQLMTDAFPEDYPRYRARSKMLIPFVL